MQRYYDVSWKQFSILPPVFSSAWKSCTVSGNSWWSSSAKRAPNCSRPWPWSSSSVSAMRSCSGSTTRRHLWHPRRVARIWSTWRSCRRSSMSSIRIYRTMRTTWRKSTTWHRSWLMISIPRRRPSHARGMWVMQSTVYLSYIVKSIEWLLMTWKSMEPVHQQSWYTLSSWSFWVSFWYANTQGQGWGALMLCLLILIESDAVITQSNVIYFIAQQWLRHSTSNFLQKKTTTPYLALTTEKQGIFLWGFWRKLTML